MRKMICAAAIVLCSPAFGQAYKWVDANGRTQYSDRPPAGQTSANPVRQSIGAVTGDPVAKPAAKPSVEASAAPKAAGQPATIAEQEQAFRKRLADRDAAEKKLAKESAEKQQRADTCDQAKRSLAGLNAGGRQTQFTPQGERVVLDDAQIQSQKALAQAMIAKACN